MVAITMNPQVLEIGKNLAKDTKRSFSQLLTDLILEKNKNGK